MRTRIFALVIVSASLFVIGDAVLLDVLANRGTPSAALCATRWNRSVNDDNRRRAGIRPFEVAVVSGTLAKERFPGCGVLFRQGDGRPWFSFSGWLHAGRIQRWDLVMGDHWGFDSPEGAPETPNAVVTADGHVRLIET